MFPRVVPVSEAAKESLVGDGNGLLSTLRSWRKKERIGKVCT